VNDHDAWVIDSFWGDEESEGEAAYWDGFLFEPQGRKPPAGWVVDDGREQIMATQKLNLEKALKDLKRQQETVEKLLRQTQRFPEEFPVGTVIKFKHLFKNYYTRQLEEQGGTPNKYDYAAIHASNHFWYLTCANTSRMTWEQLLEFIGDEEVTVMVEGEKI